MNYSLQPIAILHSPFKEKFVTPRQPGLTPSVRARIGFNPDFATPEAVRGLKGFSHLWLIFLFHQNWEKGWKPTVRPPRLGGNQRVGVYASRSPFRPNPIGLSAVRLLSIHADRGDISLEVQGADLIDGTPILDIKPYIPYGDSIPDATGGFAEETPRATLQVEFSELAWKQLGQYQNETPELETMLRETLSLDPRPAYRHNRENSKEYGVLFDCYNIRWRVQGKILIVLEILIADTAESGS
ncbi:MAG: tRNA (N6-threonylcarbamoyladenosine(37)-N6)-methyltransferase TrmO [Thermodesulfobacteriota bacterium]|nr:tRNA (N6-threonylcarbamoyladenosine(37)-N6)-methyltransferase TrmO [Thermodesulfobacteriota bacterium]